MTAAVIAETTRLHKEATQVYRTYHNVDQAIKKLIIESFDDTYAIRGHIDHDQCQACHATRGCPSTYCSTQEQDRDPKEQDQACLERTTNHQDNEQRQSLLVAWLSGSEIAYERDMQHEKERTPRRSEQEQPHGRSPMGQ
jgi:hypothetical protein